MDCRFRRFPERNFIGHAAKTCAATATYIMIPPLGAWRQSTVVAVPEADGT
jgi:hypothetical protein